MTAEEREKLETELATIIEEEMPGPTVREDREYFVRRAAERAAFKILERLSR